jgi:DNA uptake protein ComE-like DNA-binding protein
MEWSNLFALGSMTSNSFKEVISFSSSERKGIVFLTLLGVLSALFSYFVPGWISDHQIKKFEQEHAVILQTARTVVPADSITSDLSKSQKSYSDSSDKSNSYSTYYPKNSQPKHPKTFSPKNIPINTVSAQSLIQSGLEAEVAFRIIKFRDKLGGFYNIQQMKDVFGLTETQFEQFKSNHHLDVNQIKKINLNTASLEELSAHPYISEKLANQIIGFRSKYKIFESNDDVQKLYLMNDELYAKLVHYVSF